MTVGIGALDMLESIIGSLDAAGIPHMVTGSAASTFHGEPRSTQDIDIVIDPTGSRLSAFTASLDHKRFYVGDAHTALTHRDMFNVVEIGTGWKVDLIIIKDRPFSRAEFDRRISVEVLGVRVHLATAEDIVLAKLEWARMGGSERQLRDVAGVLAVSGAILDRSYLDAWAEELGLSAELAQAETY